NQNAVSCAQYYRFSPDAGKSWGQRKALFSDLGVCPDGIQLLTGTDQQAALVSVINHAVYFSKWTGQDFSPAAVDRDLSAFTDPLSFHPIQLGCQQAVAAGEEIYVIGCGTFGASSDIWVTSRSMSSLFQAGGKSAVWSSPAVIASEQVRPDTISFSADPNSGLLRAFWSQPDSSLASQPGSSIYYAGWQAPKAVVPAAVISSSSGKANQPSFALDNHGRMYVVWSGGKSGEINFSWAASDGGGVAADWFRPAVLPSPLPDAAQPKIQVDGGGALNVAFLIPLNEKRGVYFVRSTDRGASWSEPVQVFDGTAGGCDMLDQLSLAVTARGTLHASWVCSTIPGGLGPYAYRYARSADRGEKWAVLPDSASRSVVWSRLAAAAQGSLHRVWLENLNGRRIFYDQVSTDDGVGWNPAIEIASSDLPGGPADLAADPAGQLYLVQAAADGGKSMLNYWMWNGSSWAKGDGTVLADDPNSQVESLDSAVVPGGSLAVLYVLQAYDPVQKVKKYDLAYTDYPVTIPPAVSLNAPAIPGTALAVQSAPSTASQPAGSPGASAGSAPPSFSSVPKQSGRTAVTYGIGVGLTLALVLGVFILRRRGHES
ncbi:MAG TPA: sialidase family protein, partial [Anaerolineaceae bacterium]